MSVVHVRWPYVVNDDLNTALGGTKSVPDN